MLVEIPDADTLAAVFERAVAVLEEAGMLPVISEAFTIPAAVARAAVVPSAAAEPTPAATKSSSLSPRGRVNPQAVLLIGGVFAVTACWVLAIKTRRKGRFKPRELFSHIRHH